MGQPSEIGFPPCLASLIVSENFQAAGFPTRFDAAKAFNILRPYGGALCLEALDRQARFADWVRAAALAKAVVKRDGPWSLLVRDGPLPGSAPWTHESCDAARTFCSQDELVKAPLGVLWYGDHNGFVLRNHGYDEIRPQVVGGRVFAFSQQSGKLWAYDAYTGRSLFGAATSSAARGTRDSRRCRMACISWRTASALSSIPRPVRR